MYTIKQSSTQVYPITFARDGKTLATGSGSVVNLWDAKNGKKKQSMREVDGNVIALSFAPNGNLLAVTSENTGQGEPTSILRLWNLSKNKVELTSRLELTEPVSAAISHDGRSLVVSRTDGILQVWDIQTSDLKWQKRYKNTILGSVAFSPDSDVLAVDAVKINHINTDEGATMQVVGSYIHVLRSSNGSVRQKLPLKEQYQLGTEPLRFSHNGGLLAVGNQLWDMKTGRLRRVIKQEKVANLSFSPNGRLLALGSGNGKIMLWDTINGLLVATFIAGVADSDWLIFTPQRYFAGSESLIRRIQWQGGWKLENDKLYSDRYRRQEAVREALLRYH